MGENSGVSWCDHTFNAWWGCVKISEGCVRCYANTLSTRYGHDVWGADAPRRFLSESYWRQPLKWNREALPKLGRPALVFCSSMADVFEDRRDLDPWRERLAGVIDATPNLRWLLLTKRPEHVSRLAPWGNAWPANAALGVTTENQRRADERIPIALEVPAPMHFISAEPLVGRVTLGRWAASVPARLRVGAGGWEPEYDPTPRIDWVITGGESGAGHRPLDLDHARLLRSNCAVFGIPFFFKQVGGRWATEGGDLLDGVQHKQFPAWAR